MKMVKELIEEYEAVQAFEELKDKKINIFELKYNGMAVNGFSQPLTDLDYESEQP